VDNPKELEAETITVFNAVIGSITISKLLVRRSMLVILSNVPSSSVVIGAVILGELSPMSLKATMVKL